LNQSIHNNYKSSLKATSLFGGVQIYNIIINIIRSKFAAVLLGPTGMGIAGLLSSTIGLITSFTNFGLGVSAVRNISEANSTNDIKKISMTILVLRKLVWITGLLGAIVGFTFAPYWSIITFGNADYTYAFMILSVTVLFTQLTSGQNALLQGLQKYSYLARSNIIGSAIGLVVTVPLYYFWGIDAIVPVMVIANLMSFALAHYFSQKIKIIKAPVSFLKLRTEGTGMLKMGFLISLQGFFSIITSFLLKIFISNFGGIEYVGLYNAGFTMMNMYVGLVFSAMGTDYYPRLSAHASDNIALGNTINQQAEIALLLLAPIITVFIVFINWIVVILYSAKFLPIQEMLYWAIFATFFRALSYVIAVSFMAKADTEVFFWSELTASIYIFGLNILGYRYYGLTGIGISYLLGYLIYLIQVYAISSKRYHFTFNLSVCIIFVIQFMLSSFCILLKFFSNNYVSYFFGIILIAFSTYYSFKELDKRVAILAYLKDKLRKKC